MPIHIQIDGEDAKHLLTQLRELSAGLNPTQTVVSADKVPYYVQADIGADVAADVERAHPNGTGEVPAGESDDDSDGVGTEAPAAGGRVDEHGVQFNAEFCANAAKPFYESGSRKGQWKKRKGVDDVQYDAWYDSVKPAPAQETAGADAERPPANAAGAFGAKPAATGSAPGGYPTDIGGFTAWTSERMAASQITQTHVDRAFSDCGLGYHQIMPGVEGAADSIGKICAKIDSYGRGH